MTNREALLYGMECIEERINDLRLKTSSSKIRLEYFEDIAGITSGSEVEKHKNRIERNQELIEELEKAYEILKDMRK